MSVPNYLDGNAKYLPLYYSYSCLAAKCIYYVHLKNKALLGYVKSVGGSVDTLPSYYMKTIMLHYFERKQDDFWWSGGWAVGGDRWLEQALKEVFQELLSCLRTRKLENFFIKVISISKYTCVDIAVWFIGTRTQLPPP